MSEVAAGAAGGAGAEVLPEDLEVGGQDRRPGALTVAVLAIPVVVASVGVAIALAMRPDLTLPLLTVGAVLFGAAIVTWATKELWTAILVLFAVRPSLDLFKVDEAGATLAEPSVVLGVVFLAASILWLVLRARRGVRLVWSASSVSLAVLAGASLLASVTADVPLVSLQAAMRIASTAIMLVVLEQLLRERPDRLPSLLVAVLASLAVPALVALFQLYGNVPVVPEYGPALEVGRVRGTFVHPNPFAAYLSMLIPLAVALLPHVSGRAKLGVAVAAALSVTLLLFTYARAAWIAALLAVLVIGWLQDRRICWLVIMGTLVVMLTVPSVTTRLSDLRQQQESSDGPDSLSWRIDYWRRVLPMTLEGPVTGIGLSGVEHATTDKLPPHNVFVQSLVETGLAGLMALLAAVGVLARDLRQAVRRTSSGLRRGVVVAAIGVSVAFLVQCLSENLLDQPVVQWYFVVSVAWATSRLPGLGATEKVGGDGKERSPRTEAPSAAG